MELPANPEPATSTELEQLAKEQPLGKAANMGCPGIEAPGAITTAVPSGPTKIPGKTAISRGGETATNPIAIARGAAKAIPTTIKRSPTTAFAATTPGGPATIEPSPGKTGTGGG